MKADRIKWDESMAARCLERVRDKTVKADEGAVADSDSDEDDDVVAGGSAFDRHWAEFERALNRVLSK